MKRALMAMLVGAGILGTAVAATAQENSWVHLRVTEAGGATVSVDLPVSLVGMALEMGAANEGINAEMNFGDEDMSVSDLRALWTELKSVGDGQFVDITDEDGGRVRMFQEDGRVTINAEEGDDTTVRIQIPASVVDVFLGEEGDQLNFLGALEELGRSGIGDFVDIQDGETTVRAWVDNNGG